MFGHHEPAQAKVLYTQNVSGAWEEEHHFKIEFVLEVYSPTGQAFRAKATHHFLRFTPHPQVGDVINVKYNPQTLEVELDVKDDPRYGAQGLKHDQQAERQAEQARRDALLSAPPGTPLAPPTSVRRIVPGGGQQWTVQGAQMPTGFPGMSAPVNPQAAMALAEAQRLRGELEYTGASGQATILRTQQAGEPIGHFVPFFVEVLVQPDALGFPFQCSFTTWLDTSKGMLMEGHMLPVKYDPQNTARMVFLFPA